MRSKGGHASAIDPQINLPARSISLQDRPYNLYTEGAGVVPFSTDASRVHATGHAPKTCVRKRRIGNNIEI